MLLFGYPNSQVASSAQFLHHIRHRMQRTAAAQTHFGDRQLRWRSFIKRQQAYTAFCKEISGGSKEIVVAYQQHLLHGKSQHTYSVTAEETWALLSGV